MDFAFLRHVIAKALLSLQSQPLDINDQCQHIHSHIKKVTRKTAERGDVVVALLSIQQITQLPKDFHVVIEELLSQEFSPQKEKLLQRLTATLSTSLYPVEQCTVQKGVLCLWLQHGPVASSVLLRSLAVSRKELTCDEGQRPISVEQVLCHGEHCYQELRRDCKEAASTEDQSNRSVEPAPLLANSVLSTLYGANTLLGGQRVECRLPRESGNGAGLNSSAPLSSDLTAYRGTVLARHLAALVTMCGGTIVTPSCNETTGVAGNALGRQKMNCANAFGDDRPCSDSEPEHGHDTGVPEASQSALTGVAPAVPLPRLLVSWSPSPRASSDGVTVGPVVAANNKKKLRADEDWDLNRCWKSFRAELESASCHKQSTGQCEGNWSEVVSRQAWCCLRLFLMGTQAAAPLLLHTHDPVNTRDAAFLLYNYSRVHTLLSRFVSLERQGVVPPMPAPHLLQYSLLREQDEWELVWAIIQEWPDILSGLALDLKRVVGLEESLQPHCKRDKNRSFGTHAVFLHLHDLCHRFSVYYNRIHILPAVGENSALPTHMLPVLYARISLLLGLKNTMDASFSLLGVIPMKQM